MFVIKSLIAFVGERALVVKGLMVFVGERALVIKGPRAYVLESRVYPVSEDINRLRTLLWNNL